MENQNPVSQKKKNGGPPMPGFLFKIMNPLMKALLSSPFHGRVSKSLMLLTFSGRKSGRKYTTPVGYVKKGETLTVFTHSKWWKNFIGGAAVTVRLQGMQRNGKAYPVTDAEGISRMVKTLKATRGKEYAQRMGLWIEDPNATQEDIKAAVSGTYFIRIDLNKDGQND